MESLTTGLGRGGGGNNVSGIVQYLVSKYGEYIYYFSPCQFLGLEQLGCARYSLPVLQCSHVVGGTLIRGLLDLL